jgi:Putative MetA-pathway of phenol degradation
MSIMMKNSRRLACRGIAAAGLIVLSQSVAAQTVVTPAGRSNMPTVVATGIAPSVSAEIRPELVTDRPDYTESSEVVERGFLQFESGISYEKDGGTKNLSLPGALLRIGLGHRMELRLGGDGFLSQVEGGARTSGYSDVEVGIKIRLLDQRRAGFDLAVIPMASLPSGANGFTSGGIDPTVKVTLARELPAGFGLSGNINFASVSDETGRFAQRAVSLSLGHDLLAGWGGFVEAYSFTPMSRGEAAGATLDWGVSRPIGVNLQFDLEAGRGLTSPAPDWFVGAGFAVRGRAGKR